MYSCHLCNHPSPSIFSKNHLYIYLHCDNCDLVFVKPEERLTPSEEKKRYDQHENNPDDERYREFLNQLFEPLNNLLPPQSPGLDYGSGPGPTLSIMFEEAGHPMDIYDPFYANDPYVFKKTFQFITSTETVEHFYNPRDEFRKLWKMLTPGGYLGLMTLLRPTHKPFKKWHYINDDTHVSLYSKKTFKWLAQEWNANLTFYGNRVILFQKKVLPDQ